MTCFFYAKLNQDTSDEGSHYNKDDGIVTYFFLEEPMIISETKLEEELDDNFFHLVIGEREILFDRDRGEIY